MCANSKLHFLTRCCNNQEKKRITYTELSFVLRWFNGIYPWHSEWLVCMNNRWTMNIRDMLAYLPTHKLATCTHVFLIPAAHSNTYMFLVYPPTLYVTHALHYIKDIVICITTILWNMTFLLVSNIWKYNATIRYMLHACIAVKFTRPIDYHSTISTIASHSVKLKHLFFMVIFCD